MEEEWEIGEDEWVDGEVIAPGEGESPPLSDQAAGAISLLTPPMSEELAIGELEAPGRQEELPPLVDQPTTPTPPPPGSSLAQGHATAAATAGLIHNKRGRDPASDKAIQGRREVAARLTDDCCAICLQDFEFRPDTAETPPSLLWWHSTMPCSHTFHEHCIFKWLRRNAACPLCRHQLPMAEEEEEEDDDDEEEDEEDLRWSAIRRRLVYDPADRKYHVVWRIDIMEQAAMDVLRWKQHQMSNRPQS